MGANPNNFPDSTTSVLSRTEGNDTSIGIGDSGVVTGSIARARDKTWKLRALRPHGTKVTRMERLVLRMGTGMPRTAVLDKIGWLSGVRMSCVRRQKTKTPRSRRDHAEYKSGRERKVQISKGSTVMR